MPPRKRLKPSTDGELVAEFIESFLRVTKGQGAGRTLTLRPWQRDLLNNLFELRSDGRRRYRRGLVGMPRKNGKSALASGLALFGLFDEPGAEVYSCAGEKEQARIVFNEARRAVEADPELAANLKVYRDAIELPATNSVYRVLSAEAYSKEGLNPSLVIFDEVHVQPNDELWNVMSLGSGTRAQPLMLGITTAGVRTDTTGRDSLCYRLWQYGRQVEAGEVKDPTFFFRWWGAPDGADHTDPDVWLAANPALGDYLHLEDFETTIRTTPENEFRTKRLNQWVSSATAWLPAGSFEALADRYRPLTPGENAVLAFDGSFRNDSTAIVAWLTDGDQPHLTLVALWERPDDGLDWHVPVAEVEAVLTALYRGDQLDTSAWPTDTGRYLNDDLLRARVSVQEIVFDPARWLRTFQVLDEQGIPVTEYPNTADRMVPATQRFYEAVLNGTFTHDGHPALARHFANATTKMSSRGVMVKKASETQRIDAAVCAIFGHDVATRTDLVPGIYYA